MKENKYSNLFSLEGKKAMVIGGSSGIGQAIAKGLAAFGADVAIASRSLENLQTAAKEIEEEVGVPVRYYQVDVADEASIVALAKKTREEWGIVDILVNSQGYNKKYPMLEQPIEEWDKMYDVNIRGVMICCREFGRGMIEQKYGKIINIGSIGAFSHDTEDLSTGYSSTKNAVHGFSAELAVCWAKFNITVNVIAPILTATKMMIPIFKQDPQHLADVEAHNPMGRIGRPDDCIGLAVFFASEASSFVTGQVMLPDGGLNSL